MTGKILFQEEKFATKYFLATGFMKQDMWFNFKVILSINLSERMEQRKGLQVKHYAVTVRLVSFLQRLFVTHQISMIISNLMLWGF